MFYRYRTTARNITVSGGQVLPYHMFYRSRRPVRYINVAMKDLTPIPEYQCGNERLDPNFFSASLWLRIGRLRLLGLIRLRFGPGLLWRLLPGGRLRGLLGG